MYFDDLNNFLSFLTYPFMQTKKLNLAIHFLSTFLTITYHASLERLPGKK
jgi:hypothetical protein